MKNKQTLSIISGLLSLIIVFTGCDRQSDKYTRGVGIYPGDPGQYAGPSLKSDDTYRNIAGLRAAYHSSSWDYNLTAQLVTDGIVSDVMPDYINLATNMGEVPKNEREWLFDHNSVTELSIGGSNIWLQLEMNHGSEKTGTTKIAINGSLTYDDRKKGGWQFACFGSNDGVNWDELSVSKGNGYPGMERPNPFAMFTNPPPQRRTALRRRPANPFGGPFDPADSLAPQPSFRFNFRMPQPSRTLKHTFEFGRNVAYNYYKVTMSAPSATGWTFGDFDLFNGDEKLRVAPSQYFTSAWMSAGKGEEWIYVDLGSSSSFDNIKLHWINKAKAGSVQVSDDARSWKDIAELPGNDEMTDDISLSEQVTGRFVRVLMTEPATDERYILSEFEVFGKGGLLPVPAKAPTVIDDRLYLSRGNWKIQRASEVYSEGEDISRNGFGTDGWVIATVPGTALVSYWNAGALPDPNYSDNQLMISESFFNCDFWYRNEFDVPSDFVSERIFLNFDGINWKADIFVNGQETGRIEGGFIRGKFDVTGLIKPGQKNTLAVRIIKNENIGVIKEQTALSPDKNGGVLGADNPTYHASIGWDWIPTIRGRNTGIWNDVFLNATGPVTIEDPFIMTDLNLPDVSAADINIEVTLKNHHNEEVTGTLTGMYGNIEFEEEVTLAPLESTLVKLNPETHPELKIDKPKLWWPKGYGEQYLYDAELSFVTGLGDVSDKRAFKSGIREMSFDETDDILSIYINGRRFVGRGGNWGFPESNLNYRGREYDIAVAYHADMNFTMIRNWVGQTGDDEFYQACDRHGIMVWQDFWLANPADGPNPDDPEMFMDNAEDMVRRIRNHPSIAIYCGRNEGNPPEVIDTALRSMIPLVHPGIHYISHSSMGVVSGGGPYGALPPRDYFLLYGYNKFHSERGMPNVMTFESLKKTLPEEYLWPQNSLYGLHDYCLQGAQGAASFNAMIEKGFGAPRDAKEFTELAQWINYNGYRAIFEGRSAYRKGMILWMSHPAWPSMVWQTYDWYFEPTAAYFGCKKASEPIHIQWNPVYDFRNADSVEVVNLNAGDKTGLLAKAQVINMDGSVQWEKERELDCMEDTTVKCFKLEFPETVSAVHFIRLTLREGEELISDNFYWRGVEDGNYQALRELPKTELDNATEAKRSGGNWLLTTTLKNNSETPALMVRLKVVGKTDGERILPVFYSDNYISLMPGEEKVITMKFSEKDTRGETPGVEISGYNI